MMTADHLHFILSLFFTLLSEMTTEIAPPTVPYLPTLTTITVTAPPPPAPTLLLPPTHTTSLPTLTTLTIVGLLGVAPSLQPLLRTPGHLPTGLHSGTEIVSNYTPPPLIKIASL